MWKLDARRRLLERRLTDFVMRAVRSLLVGIDTILRDAVRVLDDTIAHLPAR